MTALNILLGFLKRKEGIKINITSDVITIYRQLSPKDKEKLRNYITLLNSKGLIAKIKCRFIFEREKAKAMKLSTLMEKRI